MTDTDQNTPEPRAVADPQAVKPPVAEGADNPLAVASTAAVPDAAEQHAGKPPTAASLKLDFAVGASALALALSCLMAILQPGRTAGSAPGVLVYDPDLAAEQAAPFILAGFDGPAVIQQAFNAAVAAGHVILKASDQVAAPPSSEFRIEDFVALPAKENAP